MTTKLPEQPTRRADQLRPGDRIPAGFLPTGVGAEVKFRWPYARYGQEWVFLLYLGDDGLPDACAFLADKPIPVEVAATVPAGVYGEGEGAGPDRHKDGA